MEVNMSQIVNNNDLSGYFVPLQKFFTHRIWYVIWPKLNKVIPYFLYLLPSELMCGNSHIGKEQVNA